MNYLAVLFIYPVTRHSSVKRSALYLQLSWIESFVNVGRRAILLHTDSSLNTILLHSTTTTPRQRTARQLSAQPLLHQEYYDTYDSIYKHLIIIIIIIKDIYIVPFRHTPKALCKIHDTTVHDTTTLDRIWSNLNIRDPVHRIQNVQIQPDPVQTGSWESWSGQIQIHRLCYHKVKLWRLSLTWACICTGTWHQERWTKR